MHLKQPLRYGQMNILSFAGISVSLDKDWEMVALLATEYLGSFLGILCDFPTLKLHGVHLNENVCKEN